MIPRWEALEIPPQREGWLRFVVEYDPKTRSVQLVTNALVEEGLAAHIMGHALGCLYHAKRDAVPGIKLGFSPQN